jgi:hypothetical protein
MSADRPTLAHWQGWLNRQRGPDPIGPTTTRVLASIRADLLAGRPVEPETLVAVAGLREGDEWLTGLATLGRRRRLASSPRPTTPAPSPQPAQPVPGRRLFAYGVWRA